MRIRLIKIILISGFVLACGLQLTAYDLFAQDKIIAVVNSEVITQKDLNDFINFTRMQLAQEYKGKELDNKLQEMKPDLLNRLIDDRLILQEAKKSNIRISDERVKQKVMEIRKHYTSDLDFQKDLATQGFVQADIESRIREQLLTYAIIDVNVRSKITVTPSEVTQYYQSHLQEFKVPEQWEFTSLSTEGAIQAKQAAAELRKGAEIGSLIEKHGLSVDKIKAARGGQLKKELEDVLFKLEKGEVCDPIKVGGQYYVFRLEGILPPEQEGLPQAQEKITILLTNNKLQDAMNKWLKDVKERSYINICQS
ncbi:MAG: SurA N-terminal domain-containing protein [Candidatus Omnitrophica bacterium]|nr:SurA N-terminal domain-containing protein [Candidatus Omnitrophota bacterium]MDD5652970.1 SurA N-terminal domain-containing protein [Candidatus Omnitrophota bacterium]